MNRREFMRGFGFAGMGVLAAIPPPGGTVGAGWVNVKEAPFSAAGDGTVDDTAAIQSALDSLGGDGGVVFLPPGRTGLPSRSGSAGADV